MENTYNGWKQLVRDEFERDPNSTLIGFMEVENDVTPRGCREGFYTRGKVLVYYLTHNGEVYCEHLQDIISNILEEIVHDITNGERVVDKQTFQKLQDIPFLCIKECRVSEVGNFYEIHINGTEVKLGEVVLQY